MSESPNWQVKTNDESLVAKLSKELSISTITAKVLVNRKITSIESAREFLNSDFKSVHHPFLLKDMDKAVYRIWQAMENGEKITVYGDYDVDGAVSTSLLLLFFRKVGHPIEYYIPCRLTEGYSLNNKAIDKIKANGSSLIITVDNGIMAHDEIDYANKLGIDVIVTDHHQVAETLPNAYAVVNPQRKDCSYPFKGICGAGVAFKLLMGLRLWLRYEGFFDEREEPNLKQDLDLLSIATVCDMVPLVDENRFFVKVGLQQLRHRLKPGLKALLKVSGTKEDVTATDLGFRLGPRINACGRLEDASLGVQMMTSRDDEEAMRLAKVLDGLNIERRELELDIVDEAVKQVEEQIDLKSKLGIVVYAPEWHVGVVGIVASRLVEKFRRPAFVLCQVEGGMVKGSGRSITKVNLIKALRDSSDCLEKFGGHEAAAGVTLHADNVKSFSKAFDEAVKRQISFKDLSQTVWVDEDLSSKEIDRRLIDELKQLEPYGMGNSKPVFATEHVEVTSKRIVGEDHLKLKLKTGGKDIDAIAFRQAQHIGEVDQNSGLLFSLELNEFRNIESIQMVVKNFIYD
jgi:single-stranded-DNA-specific exonuclease